MSGRPARPGGARTPAPRGGGAGRDRAPRRGPRRRADRAPGACRADRPARAIEHRAHVGPIGRLGRYTATHFRTVLAGWLLVALVLGFFAPKVEKALSGGG